MPPRQVWIFKFGCWSSILAALVLLGGHLAGRWPPMSDAERQVVAAATSHELVLPGGFERTFTDIFDGLTLAVALLCATIGALGLVVARRGQEDLLLMSGAAKTLAVATTALLILSLTNFFIVPSLFIALMTVSFAVAAVKPPEPTEPGEGYEGEPPPAPPEP